MNKLINRHLHPCTYLRPRGAPTALDGCGIRLTPCLLAAGSSRKEIRSLGPLRCSNVRWPAKSSVT